MKRILLIEDNEDHGRIISDTLKDIYYDVVWVKITKDGEKELKKNHFDLIILDYDLPGTNGLDWYYDLRKQTTYSRTIPVIFLTILGMMKEIKDVIKADRSSDLVLKPFEGSDLLSAVKNMLPNTQ